MKEQATGGRTAEHNHRIMRGVELHTGDKRSPKNNTGNDTETRSEIYNVTHRQIMKRGDDCGGTKRKTGMNKPVVD